jgi:Tfp pilus assembly protein PilZ
MDESVSRTEERRFAPRWPIERFLLYRILPEEEALSIGFLQDINLIGAKVHLTTQADVQSKISLLIRIPKQKTPISVEGEVIWQNPRVSRAKRLPTGVRFTCFKPEDKEKILEYFDSQIRQNWWRD